MKDDRNHDAQDTIEEEEEDEYDMGLWFWIWFGVNIDEVLAQQEDNNTREVKAEGDEIHESHTRENPVHEDTDEDDIDEVKIDEENGTKEFEREGFGANKYEVLTIENDDTPQSSEQGGSLIHEGLKGEFEIPENVEENGSEIERDDEADNESGEGYEGSESDDMVMTEDEFFSAEEEEEMLAIEEEKESVVNLWKGSIGSYNAPKGRIF